MKHFRSCNLCEAICGLEIEHDGTAVVSIKGDKNDPFSRGYICPKAVALKDIHEDPDRLKKPVLRTKSGWKEISWQRAFDEIEARLIPLRRKHGEDATAIYLGNPTVHSHGALMFSRPLIAALGTRNVFAATSVDQLPHHFAANYMFGHTLMLPVPDIDHTDHILIIGANPAASNGSLMTAPGIEGRLRAIKERGGKVVLVDPRKTETAKLANKHHFITPGSDVMLLAALLNVIFSQHLFMPGILTRHIANWQALERAVQDIMPERAEKHTGISAKNIMTMAHEFASSRRAVCYGRIGLSTQAHGGLCQWLVNALNIVTGNLDRRGGAMFPLPAINISGKISTIGNADRWRSGVRKLPEFNGDLPVSALAEDILAQGPGNIRALITSAGNPVLSAPNGRQLETALEALDFMVSIDIYINETTRHANIILPPACGLEVDHYDLVFNTLAVRNIAKYAPALFEPEPGQLHDWQIFKELTHRLGARPHTLKGRVWSALERGAKSFLTPHRMLKLGLLLGPYGPLPSASRLFGVLTLKRLKRSVHGIDLGALQPRLPDALFTPDKKIDIAPSVLVDRLAEVAPDFAEAPGTRKADAFSLIGRRHVHSNNSWMHNSERLVRGKNRCTLMMHPDDAARLGLADQQQARVSSRVGAIELPLEVTRDIMPGVVSIPHGYGHNRARTRLQVAEAHAGVSINDITDAQLVDELTGNAAFSGQLVNVAPAQSRPKTAGER